jgi:hypothetical protein
MGIHMQELRRLAVSGLLLAVGATAQAQSPPRDDNPLPPGSAIEPLVTGPAAPASGAAPAPGAAPESTDELPDFGQIQKARDALDELLRAYESGNIGLFQRRLDPSMVGYQVFLDGVRRDISAYKNLRINLTDTQITAGEELAVIQTAWEKRFVSVTNFRPGIFTGRATILLHRDGDGWRLAAVARDNLFASASGVLARFTVAPMMLGINAINGTVSVQIEVVDPDLSGIEGARVVVASSSGDRETLTLPEVSPGVFRVLTVDMIVDPGFATPNNGVLEIDGPGTFTLNYIDANPGENRPPSTLSRVIRVQ